MTIAPKAHRSVAHTLYAVQRLLALSMVLNQQRFRPYQVIFLALHQMTFQVILLSQIHFCCQGFNNKDCPFAKGKLNAMLGKEIEKPVFPTGNMVKN